MEVKSVTNTLLQEEIISIMLNNTSVGNVFWKHIYNDEMLQKKVGKVFTDPNLEAIASTFLRLYKEKDIIPSQGIVINELYKLDLDGADKEALKKKYLELYNKNVVFDVHHEKHIKELIVNFKSAMFLEKVLNSKNKKNPSELLPEVAKLATTFAESLNEVNFSKTKIIKVSDIWGILDKIWSDSFSNIAIGLPELDDVLNGGGEFGGAGRQEITVWIAGTNDGKSYVLGSVAVHSASIGMKVLTLSFEGKEFQTPQRMISALTGISYKKLSRGKEFKSRNPNKSPRDYFSEEELESIQKASETVAQNLEVAHVIHDSTIEHIEQLVMDRYKESPFDVLIIDYGQLVESVKNHRNEAELTQYVFRRFEKLASILKIAIHIAMQVNREGISFMNTAEKEGEEYPSYKTYHVAGGIGAMKTASTIIAINRTEKEKEAGLVRYKLLKQREGITGVEVGLHPLWDVGQMFKGDRYRYYNPLEAQFGSGKKVDSVFTVNTKKGDIPDVTKEESAEDPLMALVKRSTTLKAMHDRGFSAKEKEIMANLIKGLESEKQIVELLERVSAINSGAVDVDDKEQALQESENEIEALKREKSESMRFVRQNMDALQDHLRWTKVARKLANDGVLEACAKSKDEKAGAVSNHLTVVFLLVKLGLDKDFTI